MAHVSGGFSLLPLKSFQKSGTWTCFVVSCPPAASPSASSTSHRSVWVKVSVSTLTSELSHLFCCECPRFYGSASQVCSCCFLVSLLGVEVSTALTCFGDQALGHGWCPSGGQNPAVKPVRSQPLYRWSFILLNLQCWFNRASSFHTGECRFFLCGR